MKKTFVLDTNVLLHDPTAFLHFDEHHVVVPLKVIEEIDKFKRDLSELGRNARQVSRALDDLRRQGKLSDGVPLKNGGTLRIAFPLENGKTRQLSADDQILQIAIDLRDAGARCTVVSKDINMRIKADAHGLPAEDYETDQVDVSELYTGQSERIVPPGDLERFKAEHGLPADPSTLSPNEYVLIRDAADPNHTLLSRFDLEQRKLVPLIGAPEDLRPAYPRNKEQHFAVDALLNSNIKVVSIIGKAGTGKTLLAVAAGVYQTLELKAYRRLLVSRPIIAMGKDIGYLPGTVNEKLDPWMQPIFDAFDLLATTRAGLRDLREGLEDNDTISVEPLTYIRGRSIAQQFMIVDEAQNLTPLEVKTIITRVGHGTKIVFTGDIYQIDNPYVDSMSNGLSTTVQKFRPHALSAHIVLNRGVRSDVAELAANIL